MFVIALHSDTRSTVWLQDYGRSWLSEIWTGNPKHAIGFEHQRSAESTARRLIKRRIGVPTANANISIEEI